MLQRKKGKGEKEKRKPREHTRKNVLPYISSLVWEAKQTARSLRRNVIQASLCAVSFSARRPSCVDLGFGQNLSVYPSFSQLMDNSEAFLSPWSKIKCLEY